MQLRQETFKLLFDSGSEIQRRYFCGTYKRTENRNWYRLGNDRGPGPRSGPGRGLDFSPVPAPAGAIKIIGRGRGPQIATFVFAFSTLL